MGRRHREDSCSLKRAAGIRCGTRLVCAKLRASVAVNPDAPKRAPEVKPGMCRGEEGC